MIRPTRLLVASLTSLLVLLAGALGAGAQSASDLVSQVDARGYATSGDVDADVNELEDLARDVADVDLAVVLLDQEWPGGNDLLAVEVVETAEEEWTVLVLSPAGDLLDAGYSSALVDVDDLDRAADAAFDQPSRDPIVFARAFADGLPEGGGGDGGSGGFLIVIVVIVVVLGVGFWLLRRAGRKQGARRIEEAKAELRDDIAGVANDILELGERADLAGNAEARDHFEAGNAIYLQVDETMADATTFDAVDDLDDDLELAAWHLDAAEALLDGETVPDRPDTREPWERGDEPAAASLPDPPRVDPATPPRPPPAPAPAQRRGGSGGGGLGAVLGGVLGGVLSTGGGGPLGGGRRRGGGGLRPVPRSRRRTSSRPSSRRRSSSRRSSSRRRSSRSRGRRRG